MSKNVFESIKYLENFANEIGLTLLKMLEFVHDYVEGDGNFYNYNQMFDYNNVPNEFWNHYEIVMQIKLKENQKRNWLSCTC